MSTRLQGGLIFLRAGLVVLASCVAPQAPPVSGPGGTLEKRLAANPDDPQVNLALGEQAEAYGDYLRAEQYYLRAEALGVKEDQILPRILRALVKGRRYDEALARCRKRLTERPEDRTTRYVEVALYVALDRTKEAERELSTLMRAKPDDPRAYLALARIYQDGGDHVRARPLFEKYLLLDPNGADAPAVRFELAEEGARDAAPTPAPEAKP